MAVLLDERACTLGSAPDLWPRSRYSGAALYPGQMIVTIIISRKELFGHAFIAFEWYADEIPAAQIHQRCHEVYQLVAEPTAAERLRGITAPGCTKMISRHSRPARVAMESDPQFFPLRDGCGRKLPACFRSWMVPFADGWRARSAAVTATNSPPKYNYLELGHGINCARWVLDLATLAGIDVRHPGSSLVAIPKCLVSRADAIDSEEKMWERRRAAADLVRQNSIR